MTTQTADARIRIFSPVFGALYLRESGPDERPEDAGFGYVKLEDRTTLHMALWMKDGWRTHRGKQFSAPVLSWYQLEKLDGTPAF